METFREDSTGVYTFGDPSQRVFNSGGDDVGRRKGTPEGFASPRRCRRRRRIPRPRRLRHRNSGTSFLRPFLRCERCLHRSRRCFLLARAVRRCAGSRSYLRRTRTASSPYDFCRRRRRRVGNLRFRRTGRRGCWDGCRSLHAFGCAYSRRCRRWQHSRRTGIHRRRDTEGKTRRCPRTHRCRLRSGFRSRTRDRWSSGE